MLNEKDMEQVAKALEQTIPQAVNDSVDAKMAVLTDKTDKALADIKQELKNMSWNSKKGDEAFKKTLKESVIVSTVKDVVKYNVQSEGQFREVYDSVVSKAMTEGTATAGSELVFDEFVKDINRVINTYEVVGMIRRYPIAKGDTLKIPRATNTVAASWQGEGAAATNTNAAATSELSLTLFRLTALTSFTEELLKDTMTIPDLYNLIVEFVSEAFAEKIETAIIEGTGSGQPEGITVASGVNNTQLGATERASNVTDDDLINVVSSIKKKYKVQKDSVAWIMSQYVHSKLKAIKTTDGYPLYPELRDMANPMLMGYKVVISDVAPCQDVSEDIATADLLIFGNFNQYVLASDNNMSLEVGYDLTGDFGKGIKTLRAVSRHDGGVLIAEAFATLQNGAT